MRSSLDDALGVSERDLLDKDAGRRFLDFYGDEGIRLAMARYGIASALEQRGYGSFELETRATGDRHTLLVFGRAAADGDASVRHRLIELAVRRDRLVPHPRIVPELVNSPPLGTAYDVLTVDWLLLQSPLASFTPDRPRFPGQEAPGLGIGERVLELLYRMVERLKLEALVTVAEYFHNAVLYARELPLFDPTHAGRLRTLERVLMQEERLTLAQASWAVEWGCVRGADDAVLAWKGEAQLRAFQPELQAWLEHGAHREAALHVAAATKLTLDRKYFDERWSAEHAALEGRARRSGDGG
ncbi:MAG: hypothetical protein M3Y87_12220 [Myxococcota bacterium]|nr:hypothetical protein [Myxococcota bacterium]